MAGDPQHPPLVLAIGGHDPSGGAGLQADIETLIANGCQPLSVVTALTSQNTCGVSRVTPQAPERVKEQIQLLLRDSPVTAVKIGLLGSPQVAGSLAEVLTEHPGLPVVLDPVLAAGTGATFGDELKAAITETLCAHCTLITPNSLEARALTGLDLLEDCAAALIAKGCGAVLITGTHERDSEVMNRLYGLAGPLQTRAWPRLEGSYHGSGCTLAAAVAAGLARGRILREAVGLAEEYTWNTLATALRTGQCQLTPNRFYAVRAHFLS
jgi:hydroxymethylpyrimidine/phosphomethylpyrimidine kinase